MILACAVCHAYHQKSVCATPVTKDENHIGVEVQDENNSVRQETIEDDEPFRIVADMLIYDARSNHMVEKRNAVIGQYLIWPNKEVPYTLANLH